MEKTGKVRLKELVETLDFQIVNRSTDYGEIEITVPIINRPGIQLTGFLERFDSDRIQVIGKIETDYMQEFSPEVRRQKFMAVMSTGIPALIICHDVELLPECLTVAQECNVTLLKTHIETSELMVQMITMLQERLAPQTTMHGVLVEIYGEGVLITGESGIGKSEAAIELIKRGHRLISDDAVDIKKINSTTLMGTAPDLIQNYIELRGIGVVDVRQIFGNGAVLPNKTIDLVVSLQTWSEDSQYDRIGMEEETIDILNVKVPFIRVPIKPGRNVAVILEVAAMNNRQKKMGFNAAKAFTDRINKYFEENTQ